MLTCEKACWAMSSPVSMLYNLHESTVGNGAEPTGLNTPKSRMNTGALTVKLKPIDPS